MKNSNKNKALILFFSIILLGFFNYLLIKFAVNNPVRIENTYSRKIYPTVSYFLSFISHNFSFSLGELTIFLFASIIIFVLFLSLYNMLLKNWKKAFNYFLIIIVFLLLNLTFFQLAWGLNNYRLKVEDNFDLKNIEIDIDDISKSYKYLVLETNRLKQNLTNKNPEKDYIYKNSYLGYKYLSGIYSFIDDKRVNTKPLLVSNLFSSSGYAGIYIPFFAEPNVNKMMPTISIPFASSHEIAHQKGFASEDEANFIGFLACSNHEENFFKYSGYLYMMIYLGNTLYKNDMDLYLELSELRSNDVLEDLKIISEFWDTHKKEKISEIHNKTNDAFLKANNQPEGILTYSKVSELFIKAYKKGLIE